MSKSPPFGSINIPSDWETRVQVQVTFIEPTMYVGSLPFLEHSGAPRANILVSRQPRKSDETTANDARDAFLKESGQGLPRLHIRARSPISFDDDQEGALAVIDFPAAEQITLVQTHMFRLDGEVITQIVVTIEASRFPELGEGLRKIALTFHPED